MAERKRPEESVYTRKVKTYKRFPGKQGYYKVCYKRTNMITDCLFIDDDISRTIWKTQIEWWQEEIPDPYALTKQDALDRLIMDDDFIRIILECSFVGGKQKIRIPTQLEIDTLKSHFQTHKSA